MNKPIKPKQPSKPYPPNKDKKYNKHAIDVSNLFIKETYFDNDGKEISEAEYEAGDEDGNCYAFEKETEEVTPSMKSLLDLMPTGTTTDNVFIDLQLGYDSGHNYVCRPFESISVFYTTPFLYDEELDKYNKQLNKYEKDKASYKAKMEQYKKDLAKYREQEDKIRLEKKKASLKEQLSILEKSASNER